MWLVAFLVSLPGTEPGATAVKVPSPNYQTAREFPNTQYFYGNSFDIQKRSQAPSRDFPKFYFENPWYKEIRMTTIIHNHQMPGAIYSALLSILLIFIYLAALGPGYGMRDLPCSAWAQQWRCLGLAVL